MSKTMRIKFIKVGDMIYISHLDVQRLLQRAFRRANVELAFSQGFNPHPKMSYGNALALGVESYGEYVDIEIKDDIGSQELMDRINKQLPDGMQFEKCIELEGGERALAANIMFGDYEFEIENINKLDEETVLKNLEKLKSSESILTTRRNKKKKIVEVDIRPLIKTIDIKKVDNEKIVVSSILATGSKQNLNTNVFVPKLLEYLDIEMDPLDVDIKRNNLYFEIQGELLSPL
ncbi:radical SAM protein [Peptostreptococcus russellii]|uniref:Radical SAM protein n=1 Tax=Peptostreptococcus russellii TaxID=215200 RepID=A0A2P7Q0A2_9FIRM|nr:TIGR03936 family radical SAM-associated protein [Peptostreptococcus russellii]PSJ31403.1 radical SAM protein [Peptostreptococcus russellii]